MTKQLTQEELERIVKRAEGQVARSGCVQLLGPEFDRLVAAAGCLLRLVAAIQLGGEGPREQERAAVVAWLRGRASQYSEESKAAEAGGRAAAMYSLNSKYTAVYYVAEAIAAGEHLKEKA